MQPNAVINTPDGSTTLYNPQFNCTYHSTNGAVAEALHIYINNAYNQTSSPTPFILDIGFGTGLNALLTCITAVQQKRKTTYHALEMYPLSPQIAMEMNYGEITQNPKTFQMLHQCQWMEYVTINPYFRIAKIHADATKYHTDTRYDAIYYDAFAPANQPEMWTKWMFSRMRLFLKPDGLLITYSSAGQTKQTLRESGFIVKRLPGPPGKRHIVVARPTTDN